MRINLRQTKPMKRDLVYTTDDWRSRPFDATRIYAPATDENRRSTAPVEKVGLAGARWMVTEESQMPRDFGTAASPAWWFRPAQQRWKTWTRRDAYWPILAGNIRHAKLQRTNHAIDPRHRK